MEESKILKFLETFSLVTVGEKKVPNFSWKDSQEKKLSEKEFLKQLNYKGGIIKKDGEEIQPTTAFGIVTGYDFLECVDIDLKVLSTAQEQKVFWNEYLNHLQENILDFEDKFAVYKTKNAGYHILYKSKRVEGNLKIAKLKGHKEAIIETKGIGGYIFAYPENQVFKLSYFDIDFISDRDRDTLMYYSKIYNYVEEVKYEPKKEIKQSYTPTTGITCWDDFNQKNTVWDLISHEFTIPSGGAKAKHTLVKRFGSESAHSGYIFNDSGCLFLFSTATIYPHEKLLSPFTIFTYQKHNGDFSSAAKDLYQLGYGSRIEKIVKEIEKQLPDNANEIEEYLFNKEHLVFPIDIFPTAMQSYIIECNKKLDSNIDYMACGLLWLISVCIGNSIEVEVKRGWTEKAALWLSLVGKAGIGKTPSIKNVIFPLQKINFQEIKKYLVENEKFEKYEKLSKKDKEDHQEVKKPIKTQFIANDITLEALVDLHQESDNSVGVFKDELAGWLKDMNKYRAGSDLEFWLSCWSGQSVSLNRMTRAGSFIEKPFISVLGGIQPNILNGFYTEENKDNGFMDRMLLSFPDSTVEQYNDNELEYSTIDWYRNAIIMFYDSVKQGLTRDSEDLIEAKKMKFSNDAKIEWKRIFNVISNAQNNDNENEYLKSMYPKQKSYIPRFAMLIHAFYSFFEYGCIEYSIDKDSILKAERLSNYFIATAKKIKVNSIEVSDIKKTIKDGRNNYEKIEAIYKENPNFNRSQTAEIIGISRRQIISIIAKIKNE